MMPNQVKFSYKCDHDYSFGDGYYPEPINKMNIEFTIPHNELTIGQYTNLFKDFICAIGFEKEQVLRGFLSLALSEENPKELLNKLMEEFEIQDKLPPYLSIRDEELLEQVLNPNTDSDKGMEELSDYLRPVVELIRKYNEKRSKKVDALIDKIERDGWIGEDKKVSADTLRRAYQVCSECGNKYGEYHDRVSSWWDSECDVCGKEAPVTESRDFKYLQKGIDELEKGENK